MFETVYLTSSEKEEFLQEFVNNAIEAMPVKAELEQEIIPIIPKEEDRVREEALEKVRLIIRQFPGMAGKEEAREEIAEVPAKKKQSIALNEDIDRLLEDASVNAIEISGGSILVKKGSLFEDSGIKISENDLKQVMQKISGKTRIPLQEGVFKARLDDMSVSAVVSDLIGSSILIIRDKKA
ncbi:MAG: hypothetical protein V1886_00745 [archaeon]